MPPLFNAIVAMSENRVIGNHGKIPWHLPEDFRWFKHKTMGGTLVMGRKTYESIGKPLPGRETLVVSRGTLAAAPHQVHDLAKLNDALALLPTPHWICGGSEIYTQFLPKCALLYLTRVKMRPDGDAFFPEFEDRFDFNQLIHETDKFRVERWINRTKEIAALVELTPEPWPFA